MAGRSRQIPIVLMTIVLLLVAGSVGWLLTPNRESAQGSAQGTNAPIRQMPVVHGGAMPLTYDTTTDPDTPAVIKRKNIGEGSFNTNWQDEFNNYLRNYEWYLEGVDANSKDLGMTREDIMRWSSYGQKVNALAIIPYNMEVTEQDARAAMRPFMGKAADTAVVCPNIKGGVVNTRGLEKDTLSVFRDNQSMLRGSLQALVPDGKGGYKPDCYGPGKYIDCDNAHGGAPRPPEATITVTPTPTPTPSMTPTPKRTDIPNPTSGNNGGVMSRTPESTGETASPPPSGQTTTTTTRPTTTRTTPPTMTRTAPPASSNNTGTNSGCVPTPSQSC